jgi:undecaprenyl diphosphate synthase
MTTVLHGDHHEILARRDPDAINTAIAARGPVPAHMAVIMDGNGRWARRRGLPRIIGHREGIKSVRDTVTTCAELKLDALTLYAFSSENWNRPRREVAALMRLLRDYLVKEMDELRDNDVRLVVMGRTHQLIAPVRREIERVMEYTADCEGMVLNLALSYSGRAELADAARLIARRVARGELDPDEVDEQLLREHFYIGDLPDPDLVVRTSGEMRISNFMVWQIAYSEIHFTRVLWPDFCREHVYRAILDFQDRDRRFGRVSE